MTTLDRICALYRRQLQLLRQDWRTPAEQRELDDIDETLNGPHGLWHQERYRRAHASEARRLSADASMRALKNGNQGQRVDLLEREVGA